MRGFVFVQHEVAGIGGGGQEDELEDSVVRRTGEGPEYVCREVRIGNVQFVSTVKNPDDPPMYRVA